MESGSTAALAYSRAAREEELALREEVERKVIDFLEIDHIRHLPVDVLSYGLQKRVELARALAMRPRVLMLDEPVAGMNDVEGEDLGRIFASVARQGLAVLLISSEIEEIVRNCARVLVLRERRLAGELPVENLTPARLMHLMAEAPHP